MEITYAAYMFAHDTVHGRFAGAVVVDAAANALVIDGVPVRFSAEKAPAAMGPSRE